VSTRVYVGNEQEFALKLGKTTDWYEVGLEHFESWAERADIPWRAIKPHLEDTLDKARTLWPGQLATLPMAAEHKRILIAHWEQLRADFQIGSEILQRY
jgi:serine/threonine-protein kinase HipA